jgi:hypothetical protein
MRKIEEFTDFWLGFLPTKHPCSAAKNQKSFKLRGEKSLQWRDKR